jgi:hypothetical protein
LQLQKCLGAVHYPRYTVDMNRLREILFKTDEEDYKITTHFVVANTYLGVVRKLKRKNIVAIIKIEEGNFIALTEE